MRKLAKKRISRSIVLGTILSTLFPAVVWAATVVVGGTGAALGAMHVLAHTYMRDNPGVKIEVLASLGSKGGIRGASSSALDIGLSSRPLKDKERQPGVSARAYAKSPFIFVTSNTPVDPNLTQEELVAIYSGDHVIWSDGSRIRPILRPESDGDSKLLIGYIGGMKAAIAKVHAIPGMPVAVTDQEAMSGAEKTPGSITTATLTAVLAEGRNLKPVSVDGVAPTTENLANGTYSMSKTLYIVTGPDLSRTAKDFIRFVRSPAGAEILARTGNIAVPDGG